MTELALHQITMMEGGPDGLIGFAAEMGISRVCLFTTSPLHDDGTAMFPIVDPVRLAATRALLRGSGVTVLNAEYFPVMPGRDVSEFLPAIDCAAELGAKRLVTHIHDPVPARARDQLALLSTLARDHGLDVGLEFTGFAAGCNSLDQAVAMHRAVQQPNLTIAVDALHLFRTGGTLERLQAVDPAIIGYVQLCDGPNFQKSDDYLNEAMNRMIPGQGVFPLRAMVTMLAPHVDIDIEVPRFANSSPTHARQWARQAIAASRNLFPGDRINDP